MPSEGNHSSSHHSGADSGGLTLTKAELAEMLFDQVGLNKREAKDMVERFFNEIRESLERGESVKLSGFGNFQLRDKPQRPGRNPKTGEEIPISARRVVTFHASQKLKGQIDEAIAPLPGTVDRDLAEPDNGETVQSIDAST
ncbi:MAG: integration host factor subunit alpha [Burkholderiaceae bacterium]